MLIENIEEIFWVLTSPPPKKKYWGPNFVMVKSMTMGVVHMIGFVNRRFQAKHVPYMEYTASGCM